MPATSDHTEFQAALGSVAMTWSVLEFTLCLIMAVLIETDDFTGVAVGTALDYPRKRDVINSLAELKLSGNDAKNSRNLLLDFMSKIKGAATERNRVIHATWGDDPKKGKTRIRFSNRGKLDIEITPYNAKRLRKLAHDISELANLGMGLACTIELNVKAWRGKCDIPEAPHRLAWKNHLAANPRIPEDPPRSSEA